MSFNHCVLSGMTGAFIDARLVHPTSNARLSGPTYTGTPCITACVAGLLDQLTTAYASDTSKSKSSYVLGICEGTCKITFLNSCCIPGIGSLGCGLTIIFLLVLFKKVFFF